MIRFTATCLLLAALSAGVKTSAFANSAPVASGSVALPAVPKGAQSYVLRGERVGNLFLKTFSDAADAGATGGLLTIRKRWASPGRTTFEHRNHYAFAALKSGGSVVTWGSSMDGGDSSSVSGRLSGGVVEVFSSIGAFAALKADGSVVTWGDSVYGGDSSSVSARLSGGVMQIFSTEAAFAALKSDGSVVTWGNSGGGGNSSAASTGLSGGVVKIFSTGGAFAALKSDGSLATWGPSIYGGDSSTVSSRLSGGVVEVFSTRSAFAALKSDGSLATWGLSIYGGDSSTVSSRLSGGVVEVFSTRSAFAALKSDGSVVTWGDSGSGGDSSTVSSRLAGGVVAIFSTGGAFAALKSDGSVVTWGGSGSGGDSSTVSNRLAGGVVEIFSTEAAFAALKGDGSVVTWGGSGSGGDSSTVSNRLAGGVVEIFSTEAAFAALKSDGSVVTWGLPSDGGDSSNVSGLLSGGVVKTFCSAHAFAALKRDGSVVTWGNFSHMTWDFFSGAGGITHNSGSLSSGVVTLATPLEVAALVRGNALAGVAVIGNAATSSQGTWQFSTNGFSWTNIATSGLSDVSALVLDNNAQVRFAPAPNFAGTPGGLTVRLIETGGTTPVVAGSTRNVSFNGGTSQISAQTVFVGTTIYGAASGMPPQLAVGSGLKGTVGVFANYVVTATGTLPIVFSASKLPPSLIINPSSGTISGTPSTATNGIASIIASNAFGVVTNSLAWAITNGTPVAGQKPQLAVGSGLKGTIGVFASYAVAATGTPPITFSASKLPAGLTIGVGSGTISGTPLTATNGTALIIASNNYGAVTNALAWTIAKRAPVLSNLPVAKPITFGQALSNSVLTGGSNSVAGRWNWASPAFKPNAATANRYNVVFTPSNTQSFGPLTTNIPLVVNKATPVVTWSPATIAVGAALSSAQLNATSPVAGTYSYTPTLGTVMKNAGTTNLQVVFRATATNNYVSPVTKTASLTVSGSGLANSAPVASGTATLPAVPRGVKDYVLQGESVGNLFFKNFSDKADASRTNGLFVTRERWTAPGRTAHGHSQAAAFAALKTDGSVVAWGQPDSGGQLKFFDVPAWSFIDVSSKLSGGVVEIYSGQNAFAALKRNGSVVTWGAYGGLYTYDAFSDKLVSVGDKLSGGVAEIFSTGSAFAALKTDGSVVAWGSGGGGGSLNFWRSGGFMDLAPKLSSGVVEIFSTFSAFAALKTDGSVVTWGSVNGGDSSSVSNQLTSGVVEVFSTQFAFAALKSNGAVVTWGSSIYGGNSSSVSGLLSSGVVNIFSTHGAFAALKSDGSVVTWGLPQYGGNSSVAIWNPSSSAAGGRYSYESVASRLSSGVVNIFSSFGAFAALKSDGSVVTWGDSRYSGGDSSAVSSRLSTGVAEIFSEWNTFAALKTNGSVVTWGSPLFGATDSSAVSSRLSSGVVEIFSTLGAFAALKTNGSVVTWGDSRAGDSSSVSSRVSSGVVEIFAAAQAFAALKSDGSVVTWGDSLHSGGDSSSVSNRLSSGVVTLATPSRKSRLVRGDALAGVAVTANTASSLQGKWQYSTNGFNWKDVATNLSATSALVLGNNAQLRFAPAPTFAGTPGGLTARLIETGGAPLVSGGIINAAAASGGTNRISANSVQLNTLVR